jgi:predicted esterase
MNRFESMSEWQPIETAPIDGTDILVCMTHNLSDDEWETVQWVDYYFPDAGWIIFRGRVDIPFPPTHWMPLPEAPK